MNENMKKIIFSKHALEQMSERGAQRHEVEMAIRIGEEFPAKKNRRAFRQNFQYNSQWGINCTGPNKSYQSLLNTPKNW